MASAATKTVSKNAGRIFLPFRLLTILPAFAVLFNSDGRPVFREAHFDILRVLSQSEKLLIAFHPCLLCSDLNARCLKYRHIIARRQSGVQVETAVGKLLAAKSLKYEGAVALISDGSMVLLKYKLNNVCDADHSPANGAQRTMIILIYYNMLWLSIRKYQNAVFRECGQKRNTHYITATAFLRTALNEKIPHKTLEQPPTPKYL